MIKKGNIVTPTQLEDLCVCKVCKSEKEARLVNNSYYEAFCPNCK